MKAGRFAVPTFNLATDGVAWPKVSLAASWIPAPSAEQQDMLRVRAVS
ncbi:MAG: hypothetical protein ACR5LF_10130 [Symbiopectobacterium sp.]